MRKEAVVRLNENNLWTCDLYIEGELTDSLPGDYVDIMPCKLAASKRWGSDAKLRLTYSRCTKHISNEIKKEINAEDIKGEIE